NTCDQGFFAAPLSVDLELNNANEPRATQSRTDAARATGTQDGRRRRAGEGAGEGVGCAGWTRGAGIVLEGVLAGGVGFVCLVGCVDFGFDLGAGVVAAMRAMILVRRSAGGLACGSGSA